MLSRSLLACFASFSGLLVVLIVSFGGNPNGWDCRILNEAEFGVCGDPRSCAAFQQINHGRMMENASRIGFVRKLECGGGLICCPRDGGSYRRPWMSGGDGLKVSSRAILRKEEVHEDETCGKDSLGDRISDGRIAEIDEFPWAVQLIYRKGIPKCGGVLISRHFILTAAHCLAGADYSMHGPLKFVRLREYNLKTERDCMIVWQDQDTLQDCIEDGKLDKEYLAIKLHPEYSVNNHHQHHDIALIEINLTEKYSDFLWPICLPEPDRLNGLYPKAFLTVCGWGWTNFFQEKHGNTSSPVKMKALLPYVDHASCQKLYPNLSLKPGQICAGGRKKDACAGDSGSPLMFYDRYKNMWILSGIVSKGPKACGTIGHPGIYTSVVEYLPWIKNVSGL